MLQRQKHIQSLDYYLTDKKQEGHEMTDLETRQLVASMMTEKEREESGR